jgi:hypothetical protein
MNRRRCGWCLTAIALLGAGATLLRAQQTPRPAGPTAPADSSGLRAAIIELRVEVEMLQFDFDLARNDLLEDVKTRKSLRMAGAMMQLGGAIQSAINEAAADPPARPPRAKTEAERKKEVKEAKEAEQEQKRDEAEQAAFIAERKKELARLATALASKRLDLEDAERKYRLNAR